MANSDSDLKQLILNRRARFVAAAMCSSGIALSACREGEADPIGTTGRAPTTTTTTSAGPTVCLSTAVAPPTACLSIVVAPPSVCLSIVEVPVIALPDPPTSTSSTSEPQVCLSPAYPTEPVDSTTGPGSSSASSSSQGIADAGPDAAAPQQTSGAGATSSAVDGTAPASPLDASADPTGAP